MRIGIICSIPNEIKQFETEDFYAQVVGRRKYFKTKISSNELIIVECGIGKVNAAISSTILIQHFKCDILIFSGIAGGIHPLMKIGDVILGETFIQYDYGALENKEIRVFRAGKLPLGRDKKNIEYELDLKLKEEIKKKLPDLKMGKIITGDTFINCVDTRKYLYDKFGAHVIDMESGAVVQVSEQFGINSLIVRCVSDYAELEKRSSQRNLNLAAKNSFFIVKKILKFILND